jgi:uncharacterized protein YjbI with pentapeptide repeats
MSRRFRDRTLARAAAAGSERRREAAAVKRVAIPLGPVAGTALAGYLVALVLVGVTVLGVTHRDLLLEAPVRLPFLGTEIPLRVFFIVAPITILFLHACALVQSAMLSPRGGAVEPLDADVAALARNLAFCTLAAAPVLLLLLILIQFLPFHDQAVTWLHRIVILVDAVLIWRLWPKLTEHQATSASREPGPRLGLVVAGCLVIGLAFTAATFPGELLDDLVGRRQWIPSLRAASSDPQNDTAWTSVHDLLFHGEIDEVSLRRSSPFSNTLVVVGFDAPAAMGLSDHAARDAARRTLSLRGRRLEGAVLIGADLRKADLAGAYLDRARLDRADLQGATLNDSRMRGATLVEASLEGALVKLARLQEAKLDGVRARGASLIGAQLQGASLREAQLQESTLANAQLQGARLAGARLEGASLEHAQLEGTVLDGAELQDAVLDHAQMQGASLTAARLQGASLLGAQLQGAVLDRAELYGTQLLGANLTGASLARASLQGAMLRDAVLRGASLDHARAGGAMLDYAQLQAASLRGTELGGASLRGAVLIGASLEQANVWRARLDGATVHAVYEAEIADSPPVVRAVPPASSAAPPQSVEAGAKAAFAALKALIVHEMPKPQKRKEVMARIEVLDPEAAIADYGAISILSLGRADKATYQKVMADELVALACAGDDFGREIVLGLVRSGRIEEAGWFARGVADSVLASSCPVLATLTEADKEALGKAADAHATSSPATPAGSGGLPGTP